MCPPTWQIRLNVCFLRPTCVHNPTGKSIGSAVFAQFTAEGPILYKNCTKIANSHWGSGPHLTPDFLGPSEPTTQTASRSLQPFLQGSLVRQTDRLTDRQTDHATRSVTIGRIYVRSTAMRPKKLTPLKF